MSKEKEWEELVREGIIASAATAIEDARRYNTTLVIWRDGKIVELSPYDVEMPSITHPKEQP